MSEAARAPNLREGGGLWLVTGMVLAIGAAVAYCFRRIGWIRAAPVRSVLTAGAPRTGGQGVS